MWLEEAAQLGQEDAEGGEEGVDEAVDAGAKPSGQEDGVAPLDQLGG